ncbi:MAG TPA: PKD domain-containing protein [Bacteroidetes bacterium]|nr:PKD domain-containing protein [Bacteroidota bacterium]
MGKYYYMRLERTSPANGILSVFYDAARTQHIPNSPLCFTMQSEIDSLQYIQQGVWTSSSAGRYITATVDNLCIYDNVIGNELCDTLNCELWPKIDWNYTTTCTVTFKDVSRFGPGTTPLGNFPIDFGDGNTGTIPVGGTVTHTYPNSGTYQVCMRIFGHSSNPMYDCCTEEICTFITVDCEPK